MAESQDFAAYAPAQIDAIAEAISPARFSDYVSAAKGDRDFGLQLYLWNGRLSKAFLFPLAMCEVVTRNALYDGISQQFGGDWILNLPFTLNAYSQQSYDRARERLERDLTVPVGADDLVAALPFDFWSNLLRPDYASLWQTPGLLTAAFPNLPAGKDRKHVQAHAKTVNSLRNRIAHHEPIYDRQDHGLALSAILDLIGLRSKDVREFVRKHATVMAVARVPPSRHSRFPGRPLAQANLRPPPVLAPTDTLDIAAARLRNARPQVAVVPSAAPCGYDAVTTQSLLAFIANQAAAGGGLIDLSEHSVADLLAHQSVILGTIDIRASSGDATARFFPADKIAPPPSVLLVLASADGSPAGAILRPEIRF